MPSLLRLLTRPEERRPGPAPLEVDLRKIVLVGLVAWTVALVVSVILLVADVRTWTDVAVCAAGIALGGLGLVWVGRKRRRQTGAQAVADQSA